MDIRIALPTMVAAYERRTTLDWCRLIDTGPFATLACGERVTFANQEMLVTLAAAAALTERVGIFANLVVTPWHPTALLAKQLATLDVLSDGRLTVGVGVGGRREDFDAVGAAYGQRHQQVDDQVAELRRLWRQELTIKALSER
ncbi:hypothetical protein BH20ACT2_BH20ACT2_25220 [soil metagenome]